MLVLVGIGVNEMTGMYGSIFLDEEKLPNEFHV